MKLALMYSARCNASCSHCSTSCGPKRTEALSRDKLLSLMDEAAALPRDQPLRFGITGGEPFLDFQLLKELVAHGKNLGAEMGCVTNAYWATSAEKAHALLSTLKQAGLLVLAVSVSRFHSDFINQRRVQRALRAGRDLGLQTELKVMRLKSDPLDEVAMGAWAAAAGATRVQMFPVLPYLREGAVLPDSEYSRTPGLPEGPCPGMLTTIGWDGEAYVCAMPGAFTRYFSLGNVHDTSLERVQQRRYLLGKPRILRELGPIHFARAIQARGLGQRLRPDYTSVCELCTHIAADPLLAQVAEEEADAFELRHLQMFLDRMVEPGAPGAD